MSRKLAYDSPRITVRGDIRELTHAGTSRSLWTQHWMPGGHSEIRHDEENGLS